MCKLMFSEAHPRVEGYYLYRLTDPATGFKRVELINVTRDVLEKRIVFKYYNIEFAGPIEIEGEHYPIYGFGGSAEFRAKEAGAL